MLIEHCSGHSKAQAARHIMGPFGPPEIHAAPLESVFRTVVASVAADHVERFNSRARAIPTNDRAGVERICHALFEWRIGNHLHCNGLIAAEDIHAIQF